MEIFDIVDELGNPTGQTVERTDAHARGIRHRTAHIWVVREFDGCTQVLLQKRAANKDSFPGRFDTSSSGHMQAGDAPLESALRELEEELGIRATPEQLEFAGTFRIQYEKEFYGKLFRDNEISFVYAYRQPVDIRELKLQQEEVEAVEWFELEYVRRECCAHNPKFCVPRDGLETIRKFLKEETKMRKAPAWLDDAVFYEIYPQSFLDTNADGIGDLPGITRKLDYIRDLGCNAIWINPCFDSPFGDAGYDVSDYCKVAPRYGTNEDLKTLFAEAHKRDMHVLLDLVPGHTSVEHPWFRESIKAGRNAYTDRYVWTDSIWEEPTGYGSLRGISDRDGSCAVNFFSHQPALNYGYYQPDPEKKWQQSVNEEGPRATLEAMKNVMRFWFALGCDGFRVDMAGSLVKNDPEGKGTIALWQEVMDFLAKDFPDAAMVSEWGEPDKSLQGGFHMDFLLHFGPSHYNDLFRCAHPFFQGSGDASEFVKKYVENYEKSQRKGLICIPSGNHDMDRLARHILGERKKIAFAFLLSMPGAPFIYYGDEIGMRFVEGLTSKEGGYSRTGSRTPMQWDDGVNAGFSSASAEKLYLPMDSSEDRPTAKDQMADPDSLRSEIRRLIDIRNAHPALHNRSEIEFVYCRKDACPLVYLRSTEGEKILVVLNPSDEAVSIPCGYAIRETVYAFGKEAETENGMLTAAACSAGFYIV